MVLESLRTGQQYHNHKLWHKLQKYVTICSGEKRGNKYITIHQTAIASGGKQEEDIELIIKRICFEALQSYGHFYIHAKEC